jgi:hypothetical protein
VNLGDVLEVSSKNHKILFFSKGTKSFVLTWPQEVFESNAVYLELPHHIIITPRDFKTLQFELEVCVQNEL